MKKYLILALTIAAAGSAIAQSERSTGSFSAPVGRQTKRVQRQPAEPSRGVPVGALSRAARGNPLQMLNPRAPQKYYGPPDETVVPAPHATTPANSQEREEPRYAGLILFGLRW